MKRLSALAVIFSLSVSGAFAKCSAASGQAMLDAQSISKMASSMDRKVNAEHSYKRSRAVPGTVFRDPLKDGGEGPEMVVLPTGNFQMGSPATEAGRDSDEGPVRTVTISQRIAMGRYEVTFADYDRFVSATGRESPDDEGWGRGTKPVINVNQEDAQAYAAWLSGQTGKSYRLPSEAEWEYVARAGTVTRYTWGDSISCNQARYGRRPEIRISDEDKIRLSDEEKQLLVGEGRAAIASGQCSNTYDGTVAVGSFEPNAFGLYDLHGNVWEWVEDCWHNNYEGAPTDGSAWMTNCDGSVRAVLRGGSWFNIPRGLRSANRYGGLPSFRVNNSGFRHVQDLNP